MSEPEVYILESLKLDDENGRKEGEILARTLTLAGKSPVYRYIRTKQEFVHFLDEFEEVDYRYLHISCHGNDNRIALTLDKLNNEKFAELVGPKLNGKRLFLSSCLATTEDLAKEVFAHGECRSVAGPKDSIGFDDSVIFWTAFYHLMFKKSESGMNSRDIVGNIAVLGWALEEQFNFFRKSNDGNHKGLVIPSNERLKKPIGQYLESST